jgi:hypothetical protein
MQMVRIHPQSYLQHLIHLDSQLVRGVDLGLVSLAPSQLELCAEVNLEVHRHCASSLLGEVVAAGLLKPF